MHLESDYRKSAGVGRDDDDDDDDSLSISSVGFTWTLTGELISRQVDDVSVCVSYLSYHLCWLALHFDCVTCSDFVTRKALLVYRPTLYSRCRSTCR